MGGVGWGGIGREAREDSAGTAVSSSAREFFVVIMIKLKGGIDRGGKKCRK